RIVGIHKVEMGIVRHPGKDRMRAALAHAVPANLWDFQRMAIDSRGVAPDLPADNTETVGAILFAVIEQYLNTEADAEEGLASACYVVAQDADEAKRTQILHGGTGSAHAGQNNVIGGADPFRAISNLAAMAQMLEGARHAGEIARPIINDRDHCRRSRNES